jgi:hypothetical protein
LLELERFDGRDDLYVDLFDFLLFGLLFRTELDFVERGLDVFLPFTAPDFDELDLDLLLR